MAVALEGVITSYSIHYTKLYDGGYLGYQFANGHEAYARYEHYHADTTGFGYVDPAAYDPAGLLIRITYPHQSFDKLSAGYRARGLRTALADQVRNNFV